jgi:hypothetical protein
MKQCILPHPRHLAHKQSLTSSRIKNSPIPFASSTSIADLNHGLCKKIKKLFNPPPTHFGSRVQWEQVKTSVLPMEVNFVISTTAVGPEYLGTNWGQELRVSSIYNCLCSGCDFYCLGEVFSQSVNRRSSRVGCSCQGVSRQTTLNGTSKTMLMQQNNRTHRYGVYMSKS